MTETSLATGGGARRALPADVVAEISRVAALDRVILASDFDGTLAPFVEDPMDATPVAGAMDVLREASRLDGVTVALVSGRDVDTLRLLSGATAEEAIALVGSHGAQSSRDDMTSGALLDDTARARLADLDAALVEVQRRHPQARIERKPAAVALHTRGLPDDVAAAALADAALLGDRDGVHALAGKSVLELGVVETSKGIALRALARLVDADAVVYLGDDVTDEKAFALLPASEGHLTIKVGTGDTCASCRVDDIDDVLTVLVEFVRHRRG
ncbi:trehalose-phosphatase [Mobilicoccus pelagius]|uniref:Trehalose 6-phosphate phosphatase n=1 Tax=Mobilicoccus pelagius NBRC 104925 TaxID=1089455 RepID=H5UN71_9MICO|nr:trehalose-phosphatase [Mobilicoccus pelagius]GAB47179.1 trehalose-phosphatase [Mobilicoccus pelagius NBRC 104925]